MKKVFLDTNIVLDVMEMREPHWHDSALLLNLSAKGKIKAYISAISVATISFLLEDNYHPSEVKKKMMHLLKTVESLPTSSKAVEKALRSDFYDIEDCLQYFTATEHGCQLVTRDKDCLKFFKHTNSPKEFLKSA